MRTVSLAILALVTLGAAAPASAAQFSFSFSGPNLFPAGSQVGSGVFTTSDVATQMGGQTALAITSITGMVDGSAIVAPTGSYGNYFTTGPAFLDGTGLRFFTQAGNDIRFFYQDTAGQYRVNTFSPGATAFVTASSAPVLAVPEPATWALMLLGFGSLGVALRRRHGQLRLAQA